MFLPGVQPQKSPDLRSWIPLWDQEEVAGGQCLCSEVDCTPQPSGSMCIPGWSDNKDVFCSGISQDWTRFRLGSAGGRAALGSLKTISPRKQGRTNWDSLQLPGPLDQALLDSRPWPCWGFPPPSLRFCPVLPLGELCGLDGAAMGVFPAVGPGASPEHWLRAGWRLRGFCLSLSSQGTRAL